jgi:hypothetical protein
MYAYDTVSEAVNGLMARGYKMDFQSTVELYHLPRRKI